MRVIEALGGHRPVGTEEFARRAYNWALKPGRNPVKAILDEAPSYEEVPPLLGIFNDISWYYLRESEAHAWAKAGYTWVVNDGEHCQWEGWYGREGNATLLRLGIMPVQRLHREALSAHGDALALGARATMRPYITTFEDAERYFRSIRFPSPGEATPWDRGGYPVRAGDRTMAFTPDSLRSAENETQGWLQFETAEVLLDTGLRDRILDLMVSQGRHRACGFVGPFDVILREGDVPEIEDAIDDLFRAARLRGIHMGRVIGSGSMEDPKDIEDAMVRAMENGARLICVHPMTSDMPYRGAFTMAESYFRAADRCGF
jgi:2-keto-3-deoxy-L-rhamnonate aldolase RhmA